MTASTTLNLVTATKTQLLAFVQSIIGAPLDEYAIVAVLETYGLRDADARERFGKENVFELAHELYVEFQAKARRYPYIPHHDTLPTLQDHLKYFARHYLRGLLSNAPWAVQVACLLMFGYAFGVYTKFDGIEVTVAGVGMTLSFLVSGGFSQALGRMSSFYNGQLSYALTRQAYYRIWLMGSASMLVSALVLDGVNWFIPLFPEHSLIIGLAYYVLCGIMSLSLTLFYTFNKHSGLLVSTLAGVVAMVLVMQFTPLSIYVAHWTGFAVTSAVGFFWIHRFLQRLTSGMSKQQRAVKLPRFAAIVPTIVPYFLTGMLYFTLLLTDRLVSWSVVPEGVHLFLWIHAGYEMLVLWAFLAFSLMLPLLEYVGEDFAKTLHTMQQRFTAHEREAHNHAFFDRYMQYWLMLVGVAFLAGAITLSIYSIVRESASNSALQDLMNANVPLAERILVGGIIAYGLLLWGLMNNILLFTLSRPWAVVRAFCFAISVDAVSAWWLSRAFGYWYSIVGLALGAFVFAVLTTYSAQKSLKTMDYSYYSS